jgi:hypothetical protein
MESTHVPQRINATINGKSSQCPEKGKHRLYTMLAVILNYNSIWIQFQFSSEKLPRVIATV